MKAPELKSQWLHHTGRKYEVILIVNEATVNPDYLTTVVYKGKNGKIWCKSLDNFLTTMQRVK
jgi:hypothetical protein